MLNQRQIENHRFSTLALIKAVSNGNPKTIAYCDETETLYRWEDNGSTYTANDQDVLITGKGGNTRWLGIAGQYMIAGHCVTTQNVSSQTYTSSNSTGYALISGATITPGAGTYIAICTLDLGCDGDETFYVGIHANSVLVTSGERRIKGQKDNLGAMSIHTEPFTIGDGQAVEVMWKHPTPKTMESYNRTLTLLQVG